ncbi:unnamed protein product [Ceutorhynchus assimilis]|uniref:DUF7869 domain-containing protein n=1 Tax=Ceutorhynchus assimilis TaxID=467358 RepID=A0A9N9MIB0_9CUCU|nr:unnamed protein product [Ceutorhynchus assimilis]
MSDYLSDTSDTDPFHNSDDSDKDPDYVDSSDNENNQGFTAQAPSSTTDTSEDEFDEDQAGPSRPHVTTSRTDTSHITANDEIIENEAENNDAGMETKTKKRKRRPEKWKKNINKLKRNSGKQYINKKGIVVSEKRLGPRCQCRGKCFDILTEVEKNTIFGNFYSMQDKNIQDSYLGALIDVKKVVRRRKTTEVEKKIYSYYYHVKVGPKSVKVCRTAFCSLHGIHKSRVLRICHSRASGSLLEKDKRGKHQNRPNKVPDEVVATVKNHIESFPARESHYSRNKNKKKFLPAELNVKKMYELYLEKYDFDQYSLLKNHQKIKPKVTYDFYYRFFTQNYNLSFGYPRSDTCSSCDVMKIRIEAASTEEERRELTVQKEVHLRKAQAFYDDLKEKSELAVTDPSVETICFDYQQNLPLPVLTTRDIFYARQIWVYNQMFHSCSNNQSVSYMFDEMTAKKGCIESISFLMHFIEKYVSKTVTTLYIFTDNCAGQNKNAVMVHFLLALVSNGRFRKIVHHLPEPGHSFLPCDRNFGQIEKKKRKKELLYLPDEWYDLVQSCGKKFVVERVEQDIIFDFKSYLEPYFKKTSVIKKKPFTISKYRIFIYDSVQPDQVLVTETHNIALVVGYPLYKSPGTKIDLHVAPLAYHEKLALKTKKYDSIMPIVKKYVPPIYLEYYNTIKRAADENNAEDSD